MKPFTPSGLLSLTALAALMAGCGSSHTALPSAVEFPRQSNSHESWMLPAAKNHDLLYVSTLYSGVFVFLYASHKLVGELYYAGSGLCSDKAGDVFVTQTTASDVLEFAHGGSSPIATLYPPYSASDFNPWGCSVDSTTGNLAVTDLESNSVVVYAKARGTPAVYGETGAIMLFCAYDDKGNLFVDDVKNGKGAYLGELPRASKTFKNIKLTRSIGAPGGLEWDGTDLAVGDSATGNDVYRVHPTGAFGKVVGKVQLGGAQFVRQFWIQDATFIGPDQSAGDIGFWKYPAGGKPVYVTENFTAPFGATVSLAPRKP